jgi:hypothetical protein
MTRRSALAAFLILCLLLAALAGCGKTESQRRIEEAAANYSSAEKTPVQQEVEGLLARYKGTKEADKEASLLAQTVSLSSEELAALEETVKALTVAYPFGEISGLESAYARYKTMPIYDGGEALGPLKTLPLTPDRLYKIVKANNAAYVEAQTFSKSIPLDDDYILWACEIVSDTINRELADFDGNLDDIDANLADLKMFQNQAGTLSNALLTDDNCMKFAPVQMKAMLGISSNELAAPIIVAHETEHVIQKLSTETRSAQEITRGYGFCVAWEDQAVNSLYLVWFIEAAAEKLAVSLYDSDPLTYKTKIGYLDSLTLLNLLRGAGVKDTPRLTQHSDIERVFALFGTQTEDDRLELLRMLYAIEVIQEDPDDFMSGYAERLGHEVSTEEAVELKIELKNALCQTVSKYFYRNLAQLIAANAMTLREVFYLISTLESDLNLHISYNDESRREIITPFLENYVSLQQAFFEELSQGLNLTGEELRDRFTAYHCRLSVPNNGFIKKDEWVGITISPLSREANLFLDGFYTTVSQKKTVPLQKMAELLKLTSWKG